MKRLGLCASAFLLISCVSQPDPATQAEPLQPATLVATPASPVRKERLESYTVPVIIKETVAFADGLIERTITYTYDEGYKKLLSTVSQKPSAKTPLERTSYEYLGDAVSTKSTFGPDGSRVSKYEYTYGSNGELIKETVFDSKGLVQSVSEWAWNNGMKSSWRVLTGTGLIQARTEYFHEADRLVTARMLDGSGAGKGQIDYIYADGGKLIQIKYSTAAGSPDGKIDYVLKDGMVAQESVFRADGRLERRLSFEYGPDGALLKKTLADSAGRTREVTVYENAYRTETRTIVYYE